ncbi:energy-coupling factor transporter transmembrane component T family protein [Psittacicella hinzii]|uniref:Energy-coupling factor transport system permease protein n=1 Tax=Psittacicella hinzii TaxID=2028575 RepID=A0A3A1YRH2_9GAMM|nr:energy-coupling factor transporter transmembrane component T [Psittacicella hinzii]RIY39849.1 hypothetical protein CKF58_01400 [Psittacicella hinzii]
MANNVMGYIAKNSPIHRIHATAKLVYFFVVSTAAMITYNTWLLLFIAFSSVLLLKISKIYYREISFVLKFIIFFSVLNLVTVYLFDPMHGTDIYGTTHYMFKGWKWFQFTYEEAFFLFNLVLKYVATVPLAIIFLMTTNPSQFASSLNQVGISYKISYAVALTLRYIPDVQSQYQAINKSQQARGLDLSRKQPFFKRLKAVIAQVMPLILNSFSNIESINHAMELRRFGAQKRRTWLMRQKLTTKDYLTMLGACLILAFVFALYYVDGGRFYNPFI